MRDSFPSPERRKKRRRLADADYPPTGGRIDRARRIQYPPICSVDKATVVWIEGRSGQGPIGRRMQQ
ncbi:MAG TPA: hypothetical protein VGK23_03615 [Methanomassiliicoccales archaeon]